MWIILLYAVHIDLDPSILVAAVNNSRSYFFNCIPTTSQNEGGVVDIRWLINGTLLDDSDLNNVNSAFVSGVGGFGTLTSQVYDWTKTPHLSIAMFTLCLDM